MGGVTEGTRYRCKRVAIAMALTPQRRKWKFLESSASHSHMAVTIAKKHSLNQLKGLCCFAQKMNIRRCSQVTEHGVSPLSLQIARSFNGEAKGLAICEFFEALNISGEVTCVPPPTYYYALSEFRLIMAPANLTSCHPVTSGASGRSFHPVTSGASWRSFSNMK